MNDQFSNYPKKIKASTQHASSLYVRQSDRYAVHGEVPAPCKASISIIIEADKVAICEGEVAQLPSTIDKTTLAPVYALEPSGPLAVPTGRILVRFAAGITAVSQKEAFQRLGYTIDQELTHTPQAIWVKSADGNIASALANVSLLESLPNVKNVEPQMLMEAVRRSTSKSPL